MSESNNRGLASADQQTREETARKGGEAVSQDREHMAEIGKKGGEASHGGGQQGNNPQSQQSGSGRGSNLSEEDRAKGGKHSHGGQKAG